MNIKSSISRKIVWAAAVVLFWTPAFSFAAVINSTELGGDWTLPETWVGGVVPTEDDDVIVNPKVIFPASVSVKSLKLVDGIFTLKDVEIQSESFEISESAIVKSYQKRSKIGNINITGQLINNGEIAYPAQINLTGEFVNNGKISVVKNYSSWLSPEIKIQGSIRNNTSLDENFHFTLLPNNVENKYRVYGSQRTNIVLENVPSGDSFYFRGDLDVEKLTIYGKKNIFLDDNKIISTRLFNAGTGTLVLPNKNNAIFYEKIGAFNKGLKVEAEKSNIFFTGNIDTEYVKAKNIFLMEAAITSFSKGEVFADKIVIAEDSKLNLGSGAWHSQEHVLVYSDIINYGELIFNNINTIEGNVLNHNLITQGGDRSFVLKGNLFNYPEGIIGKTILLEPSNSPVIIKNQGIIREIAFNKDIEFSAETLFDFRLKGYGRNAILSSDTEITGIVSDVNFQSKNGGILNIKLETSPGLIGNWKDFNVVFDSKVPIGVFLNTDSRLNKFIVIKGTHVDIYGELNGSSREHAYIDGNLVNNGEIDFKTHYGALRSLFNKSIKNNGILLGQAAWSLPDQGLFKYIISENGVLTEDEKVILNNSVVVNKTINLVPKLSEVGKKYIIHYLIEDQLESSSEVLNNDQVFLEPVFSEQENTLPSDFSPPNVPEPGDRTRPIVTLNGDTKVNLGVDEVYEELGAVANDDMDGDISSNITISGAVENGVVGEYIINYFALDVAGNRGVTERVVTIAESDASNPFISLIGSGEILLEAGEAYEEYGAEAVDETDGDITENISISGAVNTEITGIYTITYSVSDAAGNTALIERTVKVTGGDATIGTVPEVTEPTPITSGRGSSGYRSSGGSSSDYTCKDSTAINFSNTGTHDQSHCQYPLLALAEVQVTPPVVVEPTQPEEIPAPAETPEEPAPAPIEALEPTEEEVVEEQPIEEPVQQENPNTEETDSPAFFTPKNQGASILGGLDTDWWKKQNQNELSRIYNQETGEHLKREDRWKWWTLFQKQRFSLGDEFPVRGGAVWNNRTVRKLSFDVAVGDSEKTNGNKTYILIHGWKTDISESGSWVERMKDAILTREDSKNAQILYLNWHDIMKSEWNVDLLNPKDKATWIRSAAESTAQQLSTWGIDKNNTTIVGHSMGTFLGGILSEELGGVKTLIALDPAYSAGAKYLGGEYEISMASGDKFKSFGDKAQLSRCFVGLESISGSEKLANTCDEKVGIDFSNLPLNGSFDEHHWVVDKYIEMNSNNSLYDMMLTDTDQSKKRFIGNNIGLKISGWSAGYINYMEAFSGKKKLVYGSSLDNEFTCDEDICEFAGWHGGDKFYGDENNFIVKDFRKRHDEDKLVLEEFDSYKVSNTNRGVNILFKRSSWVFFENAQFVVLDGVTKEEAEDWIDQAELVKNGTLTIEDIEYMPIQIK